jgi:hypothetical protein
MRGENNIRLMPSVLLAVATVVLSAVAWAEPPQSQPQLKQASALPSDPEKWVCQDSLPAIEQEIDAWCQSHPNRGLPLPPDLRNPPPVSDFDNYTKYSDKLKNFLTGQVSGVTTYKDLGWVTDAQPEGTGCRDAQSAYGFSVLPELPQHGQVPICLCFNG